MSAVKVMQTGRLATDPELKKVGRGPVRKTRVTLVVISNERWRDEWTEKNVETSSTIRWIARGVRGENAVKYLKKGAWVAITGYVRNNNYDARDGKKVYGFQFTVDEIEYVARAAADPVTPADDQSTQIEASTSSQNAEGA